jgi:disulfide bond formation protein DsbB
MYPQVLLMGIALIRKDRWMKIYGFAFSIIGAAIALFHYTGQLGFTPLPCSAVGVSVSCSQRFVMEFGYITIPMMAFSAFMLIAATFLLSLKEQ